MITLLADSNALRHPGIDQFLRASRNHAIAVSDWTVIEMQKKNALNTSRESLGVVFRNPAQCFALKRTDLLLDDEVYTADDAPNLIDYPNTAELRDLAADLWRVPVPPALPVYMQDAQLAASTIMSNMRNEVMGWEQRMVDAVADFTPDEIRALRRGKDVGQETVRKTFDLLLWSTRDFMVRNQGKQPGESISVKTAMSMFGFRYSLCVLIYTLDWVRIGSQTGKPVDKRVNDAIDMQIAAVGTFFNGVLSRDKKVQEVSRGARSLLRLWGAYVGDDWQPPELAEQGGDEAEPE